MGIAEGNEGEQIGREGSERAIGWWRKNKKKKERAKKVAQ